jgi:hypothetical protein
MACICQPVCLVIVQPIRIDRSDRRFQDVGLLIISRSEEGKDADRIFLAIHPNTTEEERLELLTQVEGLCGKHVYGSGAEFAPMLVLEELLREIRVCV